jgi:hypothetical protein
MKSRHLKKEIRTKVNKIAIIVILLLSAMGSKAVYAHLCDNVFRQKDKLIVKPENYNIVVKDKTTFKIFLQNNMDRGIAEIALIAESPAFDFDIKPAKMSLPKNQRAYFEVTMVPKSETRTGNYTIDFRLVGGGRQFKSFNLSSNKEYEVKKTDTAAALKTQPKPKTEVINITDIKKETSSVLSIKQSTSSPAIDGVINDECWRNAGVLSNFSVTQAGEARYETIILFTYDKTHIYLSFYCCNEKTNDIPRNDSVEIKFTRETTGYPYYTFLIPAFGKPSFNRYQSDNTMAALEAGAASYFTADNDKFWAAEIAVPVGALGFEPFSSSQYWYLKATRNKGGENPETSFWAADFSGYNNEKGYGVIRLVP